MATMIRPLGRGQVGRLALAGTLGVAIGWSAAPAWLPVLALLAAVVLGALRPTGAASWSVALLVLLLAATTAGAVTGERAVESAALAASSALLHAAVVALALGLVELSRRRHRFRRQGWELARALSREERARTDEALARERAAMAGEIHDHLGHRLTLVSVQLGRLTLDHTLPPDSRAALEEARRGVADAAAELGETVQLLTAGDRAPERSPTGPLSEIVRTARSAGLPVEASLADALDHDLSAPAHAALSRVLAEAMSNVAKHAPGRTVRVDGRITGRTAVLTVTNARGEADDAVPSSSGHGLPSLRHRLALLGGELEVDGGSEHTLRARVPVDATVHAPDGTTSDLAQIGAAEEAAERSARRTRRVAWTVPVGLAAGAAVLTVGFYLYLAVGSTLPPERFARIQVGMTQDEAADLLPAVEMVEAPRDVLATPEGARCVFHEEAVSLFVREDVFRICFVDGVVVSTDTIPGPGGSG